MPACEASASASSSERGVEGHHFVRRSRPAAAAGARGALLVDQLDDADDLARAPTASARSASSGRGSRCVSSKLRLWRKPRGFSPASCSRVQVGDVDRALAPAPPGRRSTCRRPAARNSLKSIVIESFCDSMKCSSFLGAGLDAAVARRPRPRRRRRCRRRRR